MSEQLNIDQIERKVWTSFFADGLWDIYLGLLLMAMGVNHILSRSDMPQGQVMAVFIGLEIAAALVLWFGKRLITRPRMGSVRLGQKAKARRVKARVLLLFSVVVGLILFAVGMVAQRQGLSFGNPGVVMPLVWAANMLLVFGLGGYFLRFPRLYVVAIMYAIAVPLDLTLSELTGRDLGAWAFLVPAVVILCMGGVVFWRFLRNYPVLAVGAEVNGNSS